MIVMIRFNYPYLMHYSIEKKMMILDNIKINWIIDNIGKIRQFKKKMKTK